MTVRQHNNHNVRLLVAVAVAINAIWLYDLKRVRMIFVAVDATRGIASLDDLR